MGRDGDDRKRTDNDFREASTSGYRRNKHIKLYGEKYLLTSEPIVVDDHVAWVDAIERKSGRPKRIAIPLPVLDVASERFG